MKFDEKHLAQLAAVVEAGGVTEGANLLGLSQPAVSRTLLTLEKRLGEPLFERGRRPLVPTTIGRQLAMHGRVIFEASKKASETAQGFQAGTAGIVRIGGVPYFMDAFISRMIGQFQRIKPDVRVEQSFGHLSELQAELRSGQLDLAICPLNASQAGSAFSFSELLPARNVVAASTSHPLLKKQSLTSNDVLNYPWIAPLSGSPLLADMHSILLSIGVSEVEVRYSGVSLMSALHYLEETNALMVLPYSVVYAFRHQRKIAALPINITQPERALGVLQLSSAPALPAAEKLGAFIISTFAELRTVILRHQRSVTWGN